MKIESERLTFEPLSIKHIDNRYVSWLNDPEVSRYMETKREVHTLQTLRKFIYDLKKKKDVIALAIIYKKKEIHIGNIKISSINTYHSHADISFFIGNKECWGKGLATEAVIRICKYAFEELNLLHIYAGYYSINFASAKVLNNAGFKVCGVLTKRLAVEHGRCDHVLCELVLDSAL